MKLLVCLLAALLPCLAANNDIDKGKMLGSADAPIRVEVFSDFECPACRAFHEQVIPLLMREYVLSGKISILFRAYPLPIPDHRYSRQAAIYSTAAARVGKYLEVSDALFRNQMTWAMNGKWWDTIASVLTPAEQKKVQELAKEPSVAAEVQRDVDLGQQMRINSTPTLVIWYRGKDYIFPGPSLGNYNLLRSLLNGLR